MKDLTLTKNALKSPSVDDKRIALVAAGHKVTVREFAVLKAFCEADGIATKAAKKLGIEVQVIYRMKKTDWWNELVVTFLGSKQDELHFGLSNKVDKLVTAITAIWDGTFDEPKLATSVASTFQTFSKLGKDHGKSYLQPLLQTKRELFIDNSVTNNTNINIDMKQFFKEMSQEEIDQYSRDGKPPQRIIELHRKNSNEGSYEEEMVGEGEGIQLPESINSGYEAEAEGEWDVTE